MTNHKDEFEQARKLYPGRKRGLAVEFADFQKRHRKWREITSRLYPAIEEQIRWRTIAEQYGKWMPKWKDFERWIKKGCWTDEAPAELEELLKPMATNQTLCRGCGKPANVFIDVEHAWFCSWECSALRRKGE